MLELASGLRGAAAVVSRRIPIDVTGVPLGMVVNNGGGSGCGTAMQHVSMQASSSFVSLCWQVLSTDLPDGSCMWGVRPSGHLQPLSLLSTTV